MAKGNDRSRFPNPKGHTGPMTQARNARCPPPPALLRVITRTKARSKGPA
jgi:hypothetical protein